MSTTRQRGSTFTAVWFVTVNGKRHQRNKGGFKTKTAAQRYADDREAEARRADYREPVDKRITVEQLLTQHWLPHIRTSATRSGEPRRENSVAAIETAVNAWVVPHIGQEKLLALTPQHVEGLLGTLRRRGGRKGKPLGARGVQSAFNCLRQALDFAVLRGFVPANVAAVVGRPGVKRKEMSYWTAAEAQAFLSYVARTDAEDPNSVDRMYAAWVLLLTRGLRRGELAGLRWSEVDLDAGRLRIIRTRVSIGGRAAESTPKTQAGRRTIPLDAGLVKVLQAHRRRQLEEKLAWGESWIDSDHVFVREDGAPLHPESVSQKFERLCKRSGVRRIRLHDLRHTAATLMLEDGTNVKVAAELLGHANPAVTQAVYQHVIPGMTESAGERLSGRLLGGSA